MEMQINKNRIAIVTVYSFPIGLAATNRILAYSKGMIANGAKVDIFIPFPTDRRNSSNFSNVGNYQGVGYFYPNGKYASQYKIFRALSIISGYRYFIGFISTLLYIIREQKKESYKTILISNDDISYLLVYSLLAKLLKISSIFIFDEFPVPIRHKLKEKIPAIKKYLFKIVLKNINGYISISKELEIYFNNIVKRNTLILPIILDTSKFDTVKNINSENESKYLCYMGNMELSKDNIDLIIRAFSLLSNKYQDINLNLYGAPSEKTQKQLQELISNLNLSNRVLFKGKVNSELVPSILSNAYILVSSQPDTKRASGGFPTKLGEYLSTGIPTLLTDVGENSKYVKDGIHVFFSKPSEVDDYAKKIEYIINNYDKALKVALNGKQFIKDNYSHIVMGKTIINFINSI
jgi:glycosyltransferase involved in cell wall biosynthesis